MGPTGQLRGGPDPWTPRPATPLVTLLYRMFRKWVLLYYIRQEVLRSVVLVGSFVRSLIFSGLNISKTVGEYRCPVLLITLAMVSVIVIAPGGHPGCVEVFWGPGFC